MKSMLFVLLFLVAQSAHAFGPRPTDTNIVLVSTTDLHGHLIEQTSKAGIKVGGINTMLSYFNAIKGQDPETVFVDSGDLFQGTLVSNLNDGASVIKFYNDIGYAASVIGNHDFDFGPGKGYSVAIRPDQDPLGALKARELQANFPFVSANICSIDEDKGGCLDVNTFTPAKLAQPYLIRKVHGLKLGIIGLTTPITPEVTMAQNVNRLRFMPMADTLKRFIPEMKSQGVQVIVVLAHSGGFCDNGVCNPSDEIFSMIDGLDDATRAAISIVFAGHTHNYVNTTYHNVPVMIEGAYGQSFGLVNLTYHYSDQSVTATTRQSLDFCQKVFSDTNNCNKGSGKLTDPNMFGSPILADTKGEEIIQTELDEANKIGGVVVGKSNSDLTKGNTGGESSLGAFMTDAYRNCYLDSTCTKKADIAFQNNGGIRSSKIASGEIIYNEIFELQPFDNMIATVQINGAQVRDLLGLWYSYNKEVPQVSGIKISYDPSAVIQRTVTNAAGQSKSVSDPVKNITDDQGNPILDTQSYTIVASDFLVTGGDGLDFLFAALKPAPIINNQRKQRDVLVDYLKLNTLDYSQLAPRIILQKH